MKKQIVGGLAAIVALAAMGPAAQAEFVPSRPLEIAVHAGPGSGNDVFARAVIAVIDKEKLSPVRIQVANKPGGGSTTASAYLASKAGESNVIGVFTNIWITDPLVQKEATNTLSKLTPIALVITEPGLIAVRADSPYKTLADFIAAAKEKPGALKQSGGSILARENILRQLLIKETGASWNFISFPTGGARLAALLGGHVDMMILEPGEARDQVRSGKIRVLAQVSDTRLEAFDAPTLTEAGFKIPDLPQIRGIVGPPDMPADAVAYYSGLIEKVAKSPEWKAYLEQNGFRSTFMGPAETKAFIATYTDQLRATLVAAGVKLAD